MRKLEQVSGQDYKRETVTCDFCGEETVAGCERCDGCSKDACPKCESFLRKLGVFRVCNGCMDESLFREYEEVASERERLNRIVESLHCALQDDVAELKAMPEMQEAIRSNDEAEIKRLASEFVTKKTDLTEEARKKLDGCIKRISSLNDRVREHVYQKQREHCLRSS